MRKLIGLILTISMLAGIVTIPAVAQTDSSDTEPTLIFDMDLSACSDGTIAVKSKADSLHLDGDITYGRIYDSLGTALPVYGKNEFNSPYLTFGTIEDGAYKNGERRVNIPLKDTEIANAESLTVTTWARIDADSSNNAKNKSLFGLGPEVKIKQDNFMEAYSVLFTASTVGIYPERTYVKYANDTTRKGEVGASAMWTDYGDKWAHYAFVRTWKPADEEDYFGPGVWEVTTYINGAMAATGTVALKTKTGDPDEFKNRTDFTKMYANDSATETTPYDLLVIGATPNGESSRAFVGDVSTFKFYEGKLSAADIEDEYLETRGGYMELTDAEIVQSNGGFDITFEDGVEAAAIPGAISVWRGDTLIKTNVTAGTVVDGYTTSARIDFEDRLGYSEEYIVKIEKTLVDTSGNSLKQMKKTIVSSPHPIGEATVTGTIGGTVKVEMPIAGATAGERFDIGLLVLNSEGRIIDFKSDSETVGEGGGASLSVSITAATSGCTVRAIAWRVDAQKGRCAVSKAIILK